jgi:hypothetical protein
MLFYLHARTKGIPMTDKKDEPKAPLAIGPSSPQPLQTADGNGAAGGVIYIPRPESVTLTKEQYEQLVSNNSVRVRA